MGHGLYTGDPVDKVTGLIDTLSSQQIITNCYNAGGSGVAECGLPGLQVADALQALQQLAAAWRRSLPGWKFDMQYKGSFARPPAAPGAPAGTVPAAACRCAPRSIRADAPPAPAGLKAVRAAPATGWGAR